MGSKNHVEERNLTSINLLNSNDLVSVT